MELLIINSGEEPNLGGGQGRGENQSFVTFSFQTDSTRLH